MPTLARLDVVFEGIATDKREIDRGFFVGGFPRSLIAIMTSATISGAPGAQGEKVRRRLREYCHR